MGNLANKFWAAASNLHSRLYEVSDGRVGGSIKGMPTIVVETTGRKSGQRRPRPVVKLEHDGSVYVIPSNNGSDDHPAWYLNIQADPSVTVTDRGDTYEATAVILDEPERSVVYEAAKQRLDNFVKYEKRAARTIPVVRLDRV
ncbi:MAG: nitroreductase/quinone reductase family protein [Nitriliruptorales bacterium]|nr:nitroreductase/quinone reductase family protein [Nitriliruptorales bacterium]